MPGQGLQRGLLVAGAGLGAGLGVRRVLRSPQVRFAHAAGSSVAAPDAAGWVTDLLNAAYFARAEPERDIEDLRLAFGIVTTRWHLLGHRRLHAYDVLAFHRRFVRARLTASPRGTLDRAAMLSGAARLIGPWFPQAWEDPARRGWGIAFPTPAQRDGYDPEVRLGKADLGEPTPPVADPLHQIWPLYAYIDELNENMVRLGRDEPAPVPPGAKPLVGLDLTAHEGHFMGRARNRLVLYEHEGQAFLRAAGTWDEMPWALDRAYQSAGHEAQQAFWGMGTPEESMLHQIAQAAR